MIFPILCLEPIEIKKWNSYDFKSGLKKNLIALQKIFMVIYSIAEAFT